MRNLRPDLGIIARNIDTGVSVLDIGCGDGLLLDELKRTKQVRGRGLELDTGNVGRAVARGLSVVQGDADTDLGNYLDDSFDYAVLSQTLQTVMRPDLVLSELLRIGKRAFVSFPNFAHWRVRASLMFGGRMPVTRLLPERWYDTPNIHHVTIDDFREMATELGATIEGRWFLSGDTARSVQGANLLAEHAVFLLRR
ncbi:MAG: methionine biosynthesis protein MetW [Pacificimonas sp.]